MENLKKNIEKLRKSSSECLQYLSEIRIIHTDYIFISPDNDMAHLLLFVDTDMWQWWCHREGTKTKFSGPETNVEPVTKNTATKHEASSLYSDRPERQRLPHTVMQPCSIVLFYLCRYEHLTLSTLELPVAKPGHMFYLKCNQLPFFKVARHSQQWGCTTILW